MRIKIFLMSVLVTLLMVTAVEAKPKVAVMDLGQYNGAITKDIVTDNLGAAASEYITQALQESGKFTVVAQDLVQNQIIVAGLKVAGIIPPSMAKKISALLNVDYIIYGTINGVSGDTMTIEVVSNGANVHTVKARIIVDMMDAKTGSLVVAKGEGSSKSSLVKLGKDDVVITIGKKKITQVSVHNAIEKAAYSMVDALIDQYSDFWEEDNQ